MVFLFPFFGTLTCSIMLTAYKSSWDTVLDPVLQWIRICSDRFHFSGSRSASRKQKTARKFHASDPLKWNRSSTQMFSIYHDQGSTLFGSVEDPFHFDLDPISGSAAWKNSLLFMWISRNLLLPSQIRIRPSWSRSGSKFAHMIRIRIPKPELFSINCDQGSTASLYRGYFCENYVSLGLPLFGLSVDSLNLWKMNFFLLPIFALFSSFFIHSINFSLLLLISFHTKKTFFLRALKSLFRISDKIIGT